MDTPNFRALCAELADRLQRAITSSHADYFYHEDRDAIDRARAALPQPAPEPPTDEELQEMWISGNWYNEGATPREFVTIARAVLARWGQGNE